MKLKSIIQRVLNRIKRYFTPKTLLPSPPRAFSHEGEDLILARLFDSKPNGFYVDVGAHHPIRYSNTHLFYTLGWNGINIDAMPGSMALFNQTRSRDINLEIAVNEKQTTLVYHIFNEPALNTFDPDFAKKFDGLGTFRIIEIKEIQTQTLAGILTKYAPNKTIDFMSVDVEGLDLAVLRSNDWKLFSPTYVLAEDFFVETVEDALQCSIAAFLRSVGYVLIAKTAHTLIFKKQSVAP